eukprot:TRINITY_DN17929_c0_g2_i1.p1 TRINITY_DN17929_c0_g2~~TRINITY_DN17929_c0_g2_i1.p1  ORF type:complete len:515 (+),score=146.23 TRINITY_DN17929_c0_g2_i1:118-1662(+)
MASGDESDWDSEEEVPQSQIHIVDKRRAPPKQPQQQQPSVSPPWAPQAPERSSSRDAEYDSIGPALAFVSPLKTSANLLPNRVLDLWADGDTQKDVVVVYRTGTGLLGKMLIGAGAVDAGSGLPASVHVRWHTWNTYFAYAPTSIAPVSTGSAEIKLIPEDSPPPRSSSFLDLSLGGFARDPLELRQAQKKAEESGELPPLAPDAGFMLRAAGGGAMAAALVPARGLILSEVQPPAPERIRLGELLAEAQQRIREAQQTAEEAEHFAGPVYGSLWRRLADVSHFSEGQLRALFDDWVASADGGADALAGGEEVTLDRDGFIRMLRRTLPAADFVDCAEAEEGAGGEAAVAETQELVRAVLSSESVLDGLWLAASDPIGVRYEQSPDSRRLNRVVRFRRFVDLLGVAVFGTKDAVMTLLATIVIPDGRGSVTLNEFLHFLATFFPVSSPEEREGLAAEFAPWFAAGASGPPVACAAALRRGLASLGIHQSWRAALGPHHGPGRSRKWDFSNSALA